MKLIKPLRITGALEGISFLVLLGVAMPLKYMYDMPMAVKIVGWAHGVLFIAFWAMAYLVREDMNWSWKWLGGTWISALLPFGTFVWDRQLAKKLAE